MTDRGASSLDYTEPGSFALAHTISLSDFVILLHTCTVQLPLSPIPSRLHGGAEAEQNIGALYTSWPGRRRTPLEVVSQVSEFQAGHGTINAP